MTTQATSNLLSAKQVAEHLGTDELTIMRLIILGQLKASRFGQKGKWMVASNDLNHMVQFGTGRIDIPPHDKAWFLTEYATVQSLFSPLKRAALPQVHKSLQRKKNGAPILRYTLGLSPAIRNVLNRPARSKRTDIAYRNQSEQALVAKFRDLAKRQASRLKSDGVFHTPIRTLYSNAENFQSIVDSALESYREMSFGFAEEYTVTENGRTRTYRVSFSLPYLKIHAETSRIIELAF